MAEMRASPVKSQALKRLADIVRLAEERGEMEILPFNPATLFPVSSTTLENLAYGNLPMAIPSQSNIPITKTGRKQEIAELAGLLPALPAASRGVAQGANYLGDVLTQAVTRNPQATSMRALEEIGKMSPVPQMFDPYLAAKTLPFTEAVDDVFLPKKLYHGTVHDQPTLDAGMQHPGKKVNAPGLFLSDNPEIASEYAKVRHDYNENLRKEIEAGGISAKTYVSEGGGNVRPVYANLQNPLVVDFGGTNWRGQHIGNEAEVTEFVKGRYGIDKRTTTFENWGPVAEHISEYGESPSMSTDDIARWAKENGYDGVILKNVTGEGTQIGSPRVSTTYVVFDPKQLKSALSDEDIMEQFLKGGRDD